MCLTLISVLNNKIYLNTKEKKKKKQNLPTISSVVVEHSVVVVEFKWSLTESIVMSPIELVIVSFALFDVSRPLVRPSVWLLIELIFLADVGVVTSSSTFCSSKSISSSKFISSSNGSKSTDPSGDTI